MIGTPLHAPRAWLLVLAVITAAVQLAHAEPMEPRSPVAREHLRRGNRLLSLDKYDEAIVEYEAGALAEAASVWYFNIALSHRKAGRYRQALDYYRRFLERTAGNRDAAQIRSQIEPIIRDLEAALTRPPTEPEPRDSNQRPAEGQDVGGERTGQPETLPPPRDRQRPKWWNDPVAIGLSIGAAVAAGTGIGFQVSASSLRSQADRETDQIESQRLRDRASDRSTIGTVSLVAAAGLGVAAVIKFVLVPDPPPAAGAAWHLAPGPGDAGFAVGVRW